MKKIKAVHCFSGGLDSIVSAKIILNQNIDLLGIHFVSPFFNLNTIKNSLKYVLDSANDINLPLKFIPVTTSFIEMLRNPKYSRGSAFNPCIDCRIFYLEKSFQIMKEIGAEFIVTGEVLGQRPMSQTRNSLNLIARKIDFNDRILRPLSAKLLEPSFAEKEGYVDREKLCEISGRRRQIQLQIAKKNSIKLIPNSGGGCLLTETDYSKRVFDLYKHKEKIDVKDVLLLRFGRQFRLSEDGKVIVARNEKEANWLEIFGIKKGYLFYYPENDKGPLTLIEGNISKTNLEIAYKISASYCKANETNIVKFVLSNDKIKSIKKEFSDREKHII